MNMLSLMYVAVGGAVGSMLRYITMILVSRINPTVFPYGTLTVNVLGSFLMGVLIAVIAGLTPARAKDLHLLLAVGALGGFTTFSTFSIDTFLLIERGMHVHAALYVLGSVFISLLALIAGMYLIKYIAA